MTATVPPRTDLRECRLYRFWVEHPVTGEIVLGYIGETVRQPFERLMEHVDVQPWIDTVVRWERDPQVFAGKDAVLRAEAAAIRAEKPLYNVKENLDNRARIIPPVAIRQRRARDAAANRPRWVHPDDRGPVRPSRPVQGPEKRGRRVACRLYQRKVWACAVVLISVCVVAACWRWNAPGVWWQHLLAGLGVSPLLLWWAVCRPLDTAALWRRRGRRFRKWLRS